MRERPESSQELERLPRAFLTDCVERWPFPNPLDSGSDGLLAYGGDLQYERLLSAYAQGIFLCNRRSQRVEI